MESRYWAMWGMRESDSNIDTISQSVQVLIRGRIYLGCAV